MLSQQIPVLIAFATGILSFFSPCILPLIPAYISFITGMSVDKLTRPDSERKNTGKIFTEILLFSLGFSIVFISLGASASSISNLVLKNQRILKIVGGVIIILFGLHTTGLLRIKYLDYEKRFHIRSKPIHVFGSLFIGMAFAIGWTPCIGPLLGAILTVAATRDTLFQGVLLLGSYSLGLTVPFLITGLLINKFLNLFGKLRKYFQIISIVSGILLIGIGILLITGRFYF
jgi:cytochrome c-type biogenesis protein